MTADDHATSRPAFDAIVDLRDESERLVVEVRGEVDIASAPRLGQHISRALEQLPHEIVVDLSEVIFIDSAGLGVLVNANQRARNSNVPLKLVLPSGPARFPFEVTGLVAMFQLYEPSSAPAGDPS